MTKRLQQDTAKNTNDNHKWTPIELLQLYINVILSSTSFSKDESFFISTRTCHASKCKLKNDIARMKKYGWRHDWQTVLVAAIVQWNHEREQSGMISTTLTSRIVSFYKSFYDILANGTTIAAIDLQELQDAVVNLFPYIDAGWKKTPNVSVVRWGRHVVFGLPKALQSAVEVP